MRRRRRRSSNFWDNALVNVDGSQYSNQVQRSNELIQILDSSYVEVNSTDTQVALSLQAALQAAIAVVVNISIADDSRAEKVTQELLQTANIRQITDQSIIIEGSENVTVTNIDTDIAITLQVLLQILLALVASLDLF